MILLEESYLKKFPEYDHHKMVVKVEDETVGLKGFIGIHCLRTGFPALGATRFWCYGSEEEAVRDALRLSRLMTYKSVLAGLPYTGAKAALICDSKKQFDRAAMFRVYAQKVNELAGKFVTGTDVGVSNDDLDIMRSESRYMIGEGVDSGYFTAHGVLDGIKRALKKVYGNDELTTRSFAIQGLGKTGYPLLSLLAMAGVKKIFVSDLDQEKIDLVKTRFPFAQPIPVSDIHAQIVDVFCPCALSGAINEITVDELQCKIVAGSANNQLDNTFTGDRLFTKGILYAPDFVINGGGIISVVDQYENEKHDEKRVMQKIKKVGENLEMIFDESARVQCPPQTVAVAIADKIIAQYA